MALPFNQLTAAATRDILPNIVDLNFRSDPWLAKLRAVNLMTYAGGIGWQETFIYDTLPGGFYKKGAKRPTTQVNTFTGMQFTLRYIDAVVSVYLEDVEVENAGNQKVIDIVDTKLEEAALATSARLAVAAYRHGQAASGSDVLDDRSDAINGFSEFINDGTNDSWDGNNFPSLGGVTRADVRPTGTPGALDAPMTDPLANWNNFVTFDLLDLAYGEVQYGDMHADIGLTTNRGFSLIKQAIHPAQRFEGNDPDIGFVNGLKFNQAVIFPTQYAPGKRGKNDAKIGNYLLSTGETFFWLNSRTWKFVVSSSKLFGFGFSGFLPGRDDSELVGRYYAAVNQVCIGPRYNYQLFNLK